MGLSGLQIQKLLPKTNCKECGSNTCMAFAMKLAAKKVELSACPYASDEAKEVLGAASEPPVKSISLSKEPALSLGGETCLYRHEKTFVHQTLLAVNVNDTDPRALTQQTLEAVRDYCLERVGDKLCVELLAVSQKSKDKTAFIELAKRALDVTGRPLVLRSPCPDTLSEAATALKGSRCIICAATPESAEQLKTAASENGHALVLHAPDLDSLVELRESVKKSGFDDLLLQLPSDSLAEQFQLNSISRRAALKSSVKALGYPSVRFLESEDAMENSVGAITEICKYGSICVLPSFDPAQLAALMTLRQNIYTDPQKPIQVEPKAYAVGEPNEKSPIFVTTNFSLTYFLVSGEIDNSGVSAWLIVPECEGMSVLTAWAAGKFSGASVAKFIKETGFEDQVETREIIIPGYVAQISGELEENLPGWKVLVGPQEAADLESFVQNRLV